jgi:hypothetical protein
MGVRGVNTRLQFSSMHACRFGNSALVSPWYVEHRL